MLSEGIPRNVQIKQVSGISSSLINGASSAVDKVRTMSYEDISFSIPDKKTVGIMGETGSGKTTLIDMVLGIISPDGGEILIHGIPLTFKNIEAWHCIEKKIKYYIKIL